MAQFCKTFYEGTPTEQDFGGEISHCLPNFTQFSMFRPRQFAKAIDARVASSDVVYNYISMGQQTQANEVYLYVSRPPSG